MAYFDDPNKLAAWERELSGLREQRERAMSGKEAPAQPLAAGPMEREAAPAFDPLENPLREPITLVQLEVDAGVRAPGRLEADTPGRAKSAPQLTQ